MTEQSSVLSGLAFPRITWWTDRGRVYLTAPAELRTRPPRTIALAKSLRVTAKPGGNVGDRASRASGNFVIPATEELSNPPMSASAG